ncbi:MAG: toprim domain-containing protein, partial [Candidatus Paceibacterota bacterium]
AKRFVYYLLNQNPDSLKKLTDQILALKKNIRQCASCLRYFNNNHADQNNLCKICQDSSRDEGSLMLIEHDIDLEAVEKADTYRGRYFILGGNIPILDKEPNKKIRERDLIRIINKKGSTLQELIIATSANSEGDNTAEYLQNLLTESAQKYNFKISLLGRGLSTGSELEYADPETIKNALTNRHTQN